MAAKSLFLGALLGVLAAGGAPAADIIVTKTLIHTGEVAGVEADGILLKLAGLGQLKVYKADILRVEIGKPAAYDSAVAALKAKKFAEAAAALKPIVDRYAGIETDWVQEAMLFLAEAYIGQNDFARARATLDQFARLYPQAPQAAGLEVKYARVLFEQKDYPKAADTLKAFLGPLLKKEILTEQQERSVAEALILLGDCQRAALDHENALDSYLQVITLFDLDAALAAQARYKAGLVFEDLGRWKRARDTYEELLKESPGSELAADAQKRLAALSKAHPE